MIKGLAKYSGLIICALFTYLYLSSFMLQDIYAATTPYATLIIFILMAAVFLGCFDPVQRLKERDKELIAALAAALVGAVNLFLIGSNKGAALIAADNALLLYLAGKVPLSDRCRHFICAVGISMMIPWYAVVRWYYNFNMAGLIFITLMVMGELLMEYTKNYFELYYLKYVQGLLFAVTLLFTICYHARSAALCVLAFGVVWLVLPGLAGKRLYYVLPAAVTAGSLVFTLVYTAFGQRGMEIRILYKDLLSGRQDIWRELWGAFLERPLTGIGSSYKLRSFFIFEVHNGLLDILVVHGIIVFALLVFLLVKRLLELKAVGYAFYPEKRIAAAGIYCYLFASFFENCFIVPPYCFIVFVLFEIVLAKTE